MECDADSIQKLLNRKGSAKQTSCIGRCWSEFCQIAIEFGEHRWKAPREVHGEEEEEEEEESSDNQSERVTDGKWLRKGERICPAA